MADFDLLFNDRFDSKIKLQTRKTGLGFIDVIIRTKGELPKIVRLDKSTAIKFAKTLRTEINKITESEVNND